MKTVILAGGRGTRLAEETEFRPKPMVEVGGQPILWHILKHYAQHGFCEFVIALGYKGDVIRRYFLDMTTLSKNMTLDVARHRVLPSEETATEPWLVHLADTGEETNTGGRLARLRQILGAEPFMLTYGDGVSNVDLHSVVAFHKSHGKLATLTAVRPPARFGALTLDEDRVASFEEKSQIAEGWISGGYFVFEPQVLSYIRGDDTSLERDVLERLAREGQLMAYRHDGFWQPMDTTRDLRLLEGLWNSGSPAWRTW